MMLRQDEKINTHWTGTALYASPAGKRPAIMKILLFLFAAFLVLTATHLYGPGANSDTYFYFYFAKTLGQHFDLLHFDDGQGVWPPMYPILLSLPIRLGLQAETASQILNCLAFGGLALILFSQARHYIKPGWAFAATLAALFSYPMLYVYVKSGSESPFIFFTALCLFSLGRWQQNRSRAMLALSAFAIIMATLIRYAGVVLFPIAGIVLLTGNEGVSRKIRRLILFGIVSALPLALWLLRNTLLAGAITSQSRVLNDSLFLDSILLTLDTLSYWLFPKFLPPGLRMGIFSLITASIAVWYFMHKSYIRKLLPFIIFTLIYALFIIFCATIGACNMPEDRLLSPLFFAMWLLALPVAAGMAGYLRRKGRVVYLAYTAYGYILLFSLAFGLLYYCIRLQQGGGGFNSVYWQKSDGILAMKNGGPVKDSDPLYCNKAWGAAYILDRKVLPFPNPGDFSSTHFWQNCNLADSGYVFLFYNMDFAHDAYADELKKLISNAGKALGLDLHISPRLPDFQTPFSEQYGQAGNSDNRPSFKSFFTAVEASDPRYHFELRKQFEDAELYYFCKE